MTDSVRAYFKHSGDFRGHQLPPPSESSWRDVFYPKLFSVLNRRYWSEGLARDVMAGVIVGIVALPLAIAFAVASGVTPDKGLITAIVAGFLISFLGGSRVQIGGPTGAFIVIVYGIVRQYGTAGLLVSTMLAGLFLIGFGLLRLGSILKFIPYTVIVGFTSGIAVTIFSTQIKDALGLPLAEVPEQFIAKWGVYLANIGGMGIWPLFITLATIGIILGGKYYFPRLPGSLVAIIITTTLVWLFSLPVDTIGSRFPDLPSSFTLAWPTIDLSDLGEYIRPAFTIAILAAIESLLSAVVADGMISDEHHSNTELIAQGVANLFSPLFGGIPATGAIARTVTNVKSGGRTPVAGMVHAATLLLITLAFGAYAAMIPMACLAGVLIVISYNMSEWRSFLSILRAPLYEIVVLLATFFLTILVDLTLAIEIGMILAAFLFIRRMAKLGTVFSASVPGGAGRNDSAVENYSRLPTGVDVFEISGPFFFAAARKYQQVLQNLGTDSLVVIIRMRHVPFVDETGVRVFRDAINFMHQSKRMVLLSGVQPPVLHDLKRFGIVKLLGDDHIFTSFDAAMAFVKTLPEDARTTSSRSHMTARLRQNKVKDEV
jgi:SulP family sulfate permease